MFGQSAEGGVTEVHGGSLLIASRHGVLTVRSFTETAGLSSKLGYIDYVVRGAGRAAAAEEFGRGTIKKNDTITLTDFDCVKLVEPDQFQADPAWVEQYDKVSTKFDPRLEAEFSMAYRALQAIRQERR